MLSRSFRRLKSRLPHEICRNNLIYRSTSTQSSTTPTNPPSTPSSPSISRSKTASHSIIFDSFPYNTESRSSSPLNTPHVRKERYTRPLKHHRKSNESSSYGLERHLDSSRKDPYKRMMNSPKRMCIVTRQILPSSFMINLRPTRFPSSEISTNSSSSSTLRLIPDRILTQGREKKGKGFWLTCHKDIIDQLINSKGPHLGILRQIPTLTIPSNLDEIIHLQLLERIKIELDLLAKRLQASPRHSLTTETTKDEIDENKPILRRLTKTESSSLVFRQPHKDSFPLKDQGCRIEDKIRIENEDKNGDENEKFILNDNQAGQILALLDICNLSQSRRQIDELKNEFEDKYKHEVSKPDTTYEDDPKDILLRSFMQNNGYGIMGNDDIPQFSLSKLFQRDNKQDQDDRFEILSSIKKILSIERNYKRKYHIHSSNSKTNSSSDSISSTTLNENENGKKIRRNFDKEYSDVLALYHYPESTSITQKRENLGIPLFIALYRLRLFLGQGWEKA
ncbi:uncharacterized protein L201_005339 [Kwoniella dendrophila CBS 6074]|uniref:Uncharacterized protein n=1 Tax=Kwoniella dendrophila CBS 6074 TaxID=1295534 RepID=A0AAX4JYY2_9TREE